ncbi:hypothetical protein FRC12_008734 [Ceratobasidium sp. 428]|nr:hypothetical protein FRC12_008734 [Ceratobasidium sp. 428]
MDWGNLTAVTRYGERWRKSRRIMHRCLERQAAEIFHPSQERQSRLLLQRLLAASGYLDFSEDLEFEVYRATAGTIMCSIYGFKTEDLNDTFMLKIKRCMDNLTNASLPSNFLVNVFPALVRVPNWFPWTEWKRTGKKWKEQKDDAVDSTYYWTKSAMAKGHEPSMIESMLKQAKQLGIDPSERDELIKNIAFGLLGAGADTSVSSILTFFTAMLLYPNTQQAAQEEIDRVVGTERLPTMKDRLNLPYIDRLLKELLRWRPPLPSGVPHACYEDDTYNNYRIPKGAIV